MSDKRHPMRHQFKAKTRAEEWPEKMKVSLARKFLGVSPTKMTALLVTGVVPFERDHLDNRVKLVKRSDLENLLQKRKLK